MNVKKTFENISIRGRIAYTIMCAENYVLEKYPNRNWKPLFCELWKIASSDIYWDQWAERIIEIIPEYLYEFPDYETSDFEYLTKQEYELFSKLQAKMPKDWNTILQTIYDMEEINAYTNVHGVGIDTLILLEKIVDIMKKENVKFPDPKAVSFSAFSQREGRGDPFDAKKLSLII